MTHLEFATRVGLFGLLLVPVLLALVVYRLVSSLRAEPWPRVPLKSISSTAEIRPTASPSIALAEPTNAFAVREHPLLDSAPSLGMAPTGRRQQFGYCTEAQARRGRLVGLYSVTPAGRSSVYFAPGAAPGAAIVREHLEEIQQHVSERLGLTADAPDIYVHQTSAILRLVTCSGASTVALYDGAIHVSTESNGPYKPEELLASVRHEYVHHLLFRNSLRGPWWLQEGAAMHIAGDSPPDSKLQGNALSPEAMTSPSFAGTTPERLEFLYSQSYLMVSFLEEACRSTEAHASPITQDPLRCAGRQLVSALRSGTSSSDLFWWAAARWSAHDARSAWLKYVADH